MTLTAIDSAELAKLRAQAENAGVLGAFVAVHLDAEKDGTKKLLRANLGQVAGDSIAVTGDDDHVTYTLVPNPSRVVPFEQAMPRPEPRSDEPSS